jgi:hypothetical protein
VSSKVIELLEKEWQKLLRATVTDDDLGEYRISPSCAFILLIDVYESVAAQLFVMAFPANITFNASTPRTYLFQSPSYTLVSGLKGQKFASLAGRLAIMKMR